MVVLGGGASESGADGVEHDVVDDIAPFGIVADVVNVVVVVPKIAASAQDLIGVVSGASFDFFEGVVELNILLVVVGLVDIFVFELVGDVDE